MLPNLIQTWLLGISTFLPMFAHWFFMWFTNLCFGKLCFVQGGQGHATNDTTVWLGDWISWGSRCHNRCSRFDILPGTTFRWCSGFCLRIWHQRNMIPTQKMCIEDAAKFVWQPTLSWGTLVYLLTWNAWECSEVCPVWSSPMAVILTIFYCFGLAYRKHGGHLLAAELTRKATNAIKTYWAMAADLIIFFPFVHTDYFLMARGLKWWVRCPKNWGTAWAFA